MSQRFKHNYKGTIGHKLGFNHILQIDFIGPMPNKLYYCTMVDITTGLGHAVQSTAPKQNTTIFALWSWMAKYGIPLIIQSDQGSHFTGKTIQTFAKNLGILWDFHTTYNPTAAGAIEGFSGLLKNKLKLYSKYKPNSTTNSTL